MNLSDKIKTQHKAASIERKELVKSLIKEAYSTQSVRLTEMLRNAADMLYADEQEIKGWREGQSQRVELSEDQRENMDNQVQLQRQINDLIKDAARYRWLREQDDSGEMFVMYGSNGTWGECGHSDIYGELLDTEIDKIIHPVTKG